MDDNEKPLTRAEVATKIALFFEEHIDRIENRGKLEAAIVEGINQYVRSLMLYIVVSEMSADSGACAAVEEIWLDEANAEERADWYNKNMPHAYKYPVNFFVQEVSLGNEIDSTFTSKGEGARKQQQLP